MEAKRKDGITLLFEDYSPLKNEKKEEEKRKNILPMVL